MRRDGIWQVDRRGLDQRRGAGAASASGSGAGSAEVAFISANIVGKVAQRCAQGKGLDVIHETACGLLSWVWALETRGRKNGGGRAARALRPPARVTAVTRSSPAAPQLCVKVVQAKALEPVYVRERPASQMPSLSTFVAVHHGSQSKMTHVANDVVNPRWNSIVELWDCEMCETIEFIVVVQRAARCGSTRW